MKKLLSRICLSTGEVWGEDFRQEDGSYLLDWKRAARFRLAPDGSSVKRLPYPHAKPVSLEVLSHLVDALAKSLRGQESLHASALSSPNGGRGVALLGESGEGKSTLAAWLMLRGWKLISDDALSLSIRGRAVLASSRFSYLKIANPRLRRRLGGFFCKYDPNLEKWVYRFPSHGPSALNALILLNRCRGGSPRLYRVHGCRAALAVQGNFYNCILHDARVSRDQFYAATRIAIRIPVWRLRYPSGWNRIGAAARLIERLIT